MITESEDEGKFASRLSASGFKLEYFNDSGKIYSYSLTCEQDQDGSLLVYLTLRQEENK